MARKKLSLADSIRAALKTAKRGALTTALEPWGEKELTLVDATGLVAVLAEQTDVKPLIDSVVHTIYNTPLGSLAFLFQNEASTEATRVLRDRGIPELLRLVDAAMEYAGCPGQPIVAVCKMFALYLSKPGLARVVTAARRFPDEFMWDIIFGIYGEPDHPQQLQLVEQLRDPLPTDFAAVTYLDLCNTLARKGKLKKHPFDAPEGHSQLEVWLTAKDNFSFAQSAAAALPFIVTKARNSLAAIAMDHPDTDVQVEAAWASAYRGGTAGLAFLVRMCNDPNHSLRAQNYLEELGHADRIPPAALEPDFHAMCQMCAWLRHPNEYGKEPTEITLYDTRELLWAPTKDHRRVWLFKYTFANHNEDGTDAVGVGMVGSITFALFGETNPEQSPEDIYGLHCCWELEMNNDRRAPKKRTAKAGRKLLGL